MQEIEVVVFRSEDDVEGEHPARRRSAAGRRLVQAVITLLVVAGVQVGPVVVEQPVERAAAPHPRPNDAGGCPDPAGLRLWCSFIDDPGCCQVPGLDLVPGVQPPRSRAA